MSPVTGETGGPAVDRDRTARQQLPPPIAELAGAWRPSALVLDLDGTVVDDQLRIHPRVTAAVRAASRQVPVILATGRMYRSARPWALELGVVHPLVCYQGALIKSVGDSIASGEVVFERGLDPEAAVLAIELARSRGWHRQAYQDDQLLCEEDRPEARIYSRIAQVDIHLVDDLAELAGRGTTKLVFVSGDPEVVDTCFDTMTRNLAGRARVTRSTAEFVEMVDPRVNKAAAVGMVCEGLGVRLADAVAIGDAPNDIEMLFGAGCGVAVRAARDEVLAVADATCAPPEQGGVADVLEHFGLTVSP